MAESAPLGSLRTLEEPRRIERLIRSAITDLGINLRGIRVLTEAASGPFVVTPLIAAMAGADRVVAVTRDSRYGRAADVKAYTEALAERFGVAGRIEVSLQPAIAHATEADLVTNLGFLRPLDSAFIEALPRGSAIALMWETWEYRPGEVDLAACRKAQVPILGTTETIDRLQIFRYVGVSALKLVLECNVEVFKSRLLVIGSDPFAWETKQVLEANGATVMVVDPGERPGILREDAVYRFLQEADALVLVEYRHWFPLIGGEAGVPIEWLEDAGIPVAHVCGLVDYDGLETAGIRKHPARRVDPGYMAVTTDYAGPRPVIDLHAAGLKVGEALVRGMRLVGTTDGAIDYAMRHSPAMAWPADIWPLAAN